MPASGSAVFCARPLCVTLGVARWTVPRMGFFGCSAAGGAAVEAIASAPPFAVFGVGCASRAFAVDATAGATPRVFGAALDLAEALVSEARAVCPGTFADGTAFPWGCDGVLTAGREATEAC